MNLQPVPAGFLRIDARAVTDGRGVLAAPGSLLLRIDPVQGCARRVRARVLAAGTPQTVAGHPSAAAARLIRRPEAVLVPGLVNAHTHLDLTHIGPVPFDEAGGFAAWADMIRRNRLAEPGPIAESVRRGVELSLAAGVVAVGDIAGAVLGRASPHAVQALQATEINGVSFVEFFAVGPTAAVNVDLAVAVARERDQAALPHGAVAVGLSPHAPYSVHPEAYRRAIRSRHRRDLPLTTHLAESPAEREFIQHARGPLRDLLERIGVWDQAMASEVGRGRSPVGHLAGAGIDASPGPMSFVHLNDIDASEARTLLAAPASAAIYCPRASEYFRAETAFGPHRYRELLAAAPGRVAIGTDSIVNLPVGSERAESAQFGPLEEIRRLFRRDAGNPAQLLAMATVAGARALGLRPSGFEFTVGENLAGVVAIGAGEAADVLGRLLLDGGPPELLVLGTADH